MEITVRPSIVPMTVLSVLATLAVSASAGAATPPPGFSPRGVSPIISQPAKKALINAPQVAGRRVPGHFIVLIRKGESPRRVARSVGAHVERVYRRVANGFSAKLSRSQVTRLKRAHAVKSVEQDAYGGTTTVQPTISGDPWGLDRIDSRTGLSASYVYGYAGAGVRAYVIDTGIDTANTEFGGRAQNVADFVGGNGQDCQGHGTHVAGTIGGSTYGVAKQVWLRGVRIMGCTGGYTDATLVAALDWVRTHGIKPAVVNMSIGGPRSPAVNAATANLANAGFFVAVAAGNDSIDACGVSPASAYGTFTVGAIDSGDTRASFSNYGACMNAYGPGVRVLSAKIGGGAQFLNGTSMATPHVTGIVALAKSAYGDSYPTATWVNWLRDNATAGVSSEGIVRGNPAGTPNRIVFKGTL